MTTARPQAVNPTTGEIHTLVDVTFQLIDINKELENAQPTLNALLEEHQRVALRYAIEYATAVKASTGRSEEVRKADGIARVATVTLPDSSPDASLCLAERKAILEMRIKAMREAMHNLRARANLLQTAAANMRTEHSLSGWKP